MKTKYSNVFAIAFLSLAGISQSALAGPMTLVDRHTFDACAAMTEDAMTADPTCAAMMKKMDMSSADMKMAKSCMAMSDDAMMKDQGCATMMKAHPQIFSHKGGGY